MFYGYDALGRTTIMTDWVRSMARCTCGHATTAQTWGASPSGFPNATPSRAFPPARSRCTNTPTPTTTPSVIPIPYKVTDNIDDARDANNAATTIDDADTIHVFDDLPCMPNSFVAGTLVESIDGLVPIETLAEGDLVWAVDPETGAAGWYPITWTTKHEDAELVTLSVTLLNADGEALSSTQERTVVVTITATLEHPFWVEGIGWIDAGDLEAGDVLLSADGRRLVVQAAVRSAGPAMVYNFTVDALHTYTVTELRVVVHNVDDQCSKIPGLPFRGTDAPQRAFDWLRKYHGIPEHVASNRLHKIKKASALGAADNVVIGKSGDVYDEVSEDLLGSLTDSSWGTER